ncbi:MAG: hydroxyacid dehydrogenase, partial [Deltaproteobacteria bacterium]|nr:hydroxyacid dehydrogenase [Deltaproteobacteria bacterium]
RKLTRDELFTLLTERVKGIIAGLEPLDRQVLEKTDLKVISRVGSGLSNVDIDAARALGVKVYYTPDGPTDAVAEMTLGAMLNLMRMISFMDRELHEGHWNKRVGAQLSGKTVAVVGYGRIGKRLAELLTPFKVEIFLVDPALEKDYVPYPLVELDEVLPRADIITIHCSTTDCLIGRSELGRMKEGVFLLNASRGGVVDEDALIESLETGRVSGAWLDVFENEPYDGPLKDFPRVVLTPHVGSYTLECRRKMEKEAVENLILGFEEK